jgi:hypothetical protein
MTVRKLTKKYWFSVEGETEKWYLKWLEAEINKSEEALYKVSFDCPVEKNPLRRAKRLAMTAKIDIWHIADYESDNQLHQEQFLDTIGKMKNVKDLGKQITYKFGYTNLTFELWILLHMKDFHMPMYHRKDYLKAINDAYEERFTRMKDYKHEHSFERCLSKMNLSNVINAVQRAKAIMKRNKDNNYVLQQYKGYHYYKENPALTIYEIIDKILKDCGLR